MKTAKDSIGCRFGRLVVVSLSSKDKYRRWHVNVVCDCGVEKTVVFAAISSGGTRSCGCLAKEHAKIIAIQSSTTHGLTGTPTYASWRSMLNRCRHPENNPYGTYDGVSVCHRWEKFENFLADMGERPKGTSLDRFPDGSGDYCPENCRWATPKEQALNRKTTRWFDWDGQRYCMADLAKHVGIQRLTLLQRLKLGWSLEKAITTPDDGSSRKKLYEIDGDMLTLDEVSEKYHVPADTLKTRLALGKTMDEAVVPTGKEYANTNRSRTIVVEGERVDVATASTLTGIAYSVLLYRMNSGWPEHLLLTPPIIGNNGTTSRAQTNINEL